MIYPTRAGAREWFIRESVADIQNDSRVDGDLADDLAGGDNTAGFTVKDNGQVRLKVCPESSMRGYSKTNLDHSTAKGQGFMSSDKEWDMKGLEMTARIKCTDFDTSDSRFIIKAPTGSHKSNTKDCSGSNYLVRFFLAPSGSDSGTTEFAKEQWHVHYVTKDSTTKSTGMGSLHNKWVICKLILYRTKDSTGKFDGKVKCEAWLCTNDDGITFKKVNETVDTGGWGDAAKDCGADNDDEIMTWKGPFVIFRWDGPTILFRDLSVREIDPYGDAGEPVPTPTGSLFRDYTIKYNLVVFPIDSCSLGQDVSTFKSIYDVTDDGSQSNLHKERYRVAILLNNSNSDLIGKKPRRIIMRLSKTGTLPSGDVTCVIRDGNTDEVVATFNYTGGNLAANSLSTSKTNYTFENLTSNYVLKNGDMLCVEYSGNTVDTANEVNVFRNEDDPFDGANTCARKFDSGGIPPTAWSSPDVFRDYAWQIFETTETTGT